MIRIIIIILTMAGFLIAEENLKLDFPAFEEFKLENEVEADTSKYIKIDSLKISIRDLNNEDISQRNLPSDTSGVVVTEILEGSPLIFINVNDVIVELQKKRIKNSNQFSSLVEKIIESGEKTLLLAIFNSRNQRSYLTIKLK